MITFSPSKVSHITGAGAPNYLDGAYDVVMHTIGALEVAFTVSYDDNTLSAFDITDPTTPTLLDTITGTGSPNYLDGPTSIAISVIGGTEYALITSFRDNALTIFDVSDPTNITHTGDIAGIDAPNYLEGAYAVYEYTISGTEYALVASYTNDAFVIIDISTPGSPSKTAHLTGAGTSNYLGGAHGVVAAAISANHYAFVVGYTDNSVVAIDIDTPGSPALADTPTGASPPNYLGGAHSLDYGLVSTTEYLFITAFTDDALTVIDVSTPATMAQVGELIGADSPNYLERPAGIKLTTLESEKVCFISSYWDDSIVTVNVETPSSPVYSGGIIGREDYIPDHPGAIVGVSDLLGGVHALDLRTIDGTHYIAAVSYEDDALVILEADPLGETQSLSCTVAITSDVSANMQKGVAATLTVTVAIASSVILNNTSISGDLLAEIKKPHWYPITRLSMVDSGGTKHDVTDKVADWDRILWQIEQKYYPNVFTGNNCRLTLKNENEEYDIDKSDNYFVDTLGREQDGYKTPCIIECGYKLPDGEIALVPFFYGLIVEIEATTDHDRVGIQLQDVSRVLMDEEILDFGTQWTGARIYGGNTFTEVNTPVTGTRLEDTQIKVSGGNFPDDFPLSGYVKLEDEIVYYSYLSTDGLEGVKRGRLGTNMVAHDVGIKVFLLLDDGSDCDGVFFQFPEFPISEGSVSSVTSSDGTVEIIESGSFIFGTPSDEQNLKGYIDYEKGVLELADEPTDSGSLVATFKSAFRNVTYHSLARELLTRQSYRTDHIEDITFNDYLDRTIPAVFGSISTVWDGDNPISISGGQVLAITLGSDDNLYIGLGRYLLRFNGEKYDLLADLGIDHLIYRLGADNDGNIYGISGSDDPDDPFYPQIDKDVFKWDGQSIEILVSGEAAYYNFTNIQEHTSGQSEGSQWKGFSVDTANNVVWYLFNTGANEGVAKIAFAGGSPTRYNRTVEDERMDFTDAGLTIEFFYLAGGTDYIQYDTLTKAGGTWTARGIVKSGFGNPQKVLDVIYNPFDGKIYFNVIDITGTEARQWHGGFYSVIKGTTTVTLIETYSGIPTGKDYPYESRYCGGVIVGDYIYFVKGAGISYGDPVDSATGHLVRVNNNAIDDLSSIGLRPATRTSRGHFLREQVTGHSAVMAYRPTDGTVFYIISDAVVRYDEDYQYSPGAYSKIYTPRIRVADLNGRNVWDVLSEIAVLSGYELGVSRDGDVFIRERASDIEVLNGDHNDSVATITASGVWIADFPTEGYIQIGSEVIEYTGVSGSTFTGCIRGSYNSTASTHPDEAQIWRIDQIIGNFPSPLEDTLVTANRLSNQEEIYNIIEVPYGEFKIKFDYEFAGESFAGSSESLYGRKPLTISNSFLTNDDYYQAESLGFIYYSRNNSRHSLLEVDTKFQPQLGLGDMLSVKQNIRVLLDYSISRIRRIELNINDFGVRIMALVKPGRYRRSLGDYEYYDYG